MLARLLTAAGSEGPRPALLHGDKAATRAELALAARACAAAWSGRTATRVGLAACDPTALVVALAALDHLGADVVLDAPGAGPDALRDADIRAAAASAAADWPPPGPPGSVTLFTSGTTGAPKAVRHTWATLARPVRSAAALRGARWLCGYPLCLYAGLQALLQALATGGALVLPDGRGPGAAARALTRHGVTHAAGTPTFWRQMLLFADSAPARLRQVTLGGEVAPQELLDRLRAAFPGARLAHIYATSELGRLFSVADGRAGFPAAWLVAPPEPGVALRVVDGELHARSANGAAGGWLATGDLVEVADDRVYFRGRRGDLINVGGIKVAPLVVEETLRGVAGVADLRAYGRRSSLAGQLVALDVVAAPGADPAAVRAALAAAARRLRPAERPAVVRFLDALEAGPAFKTLRGGGA